MTTPKPQPPATRAPEALRVSNITIEANGNTILDGVSLGIRSGELVALIGASGAGKTTLLTSIAGITRPTSGAVTLDGRHVTTRTARQRIGFVPQDDIIHLDLTLRRTLHHAARLRLPSTASAVDVETAVERVLRDLDLSGHGDVTVRNLSGGQRKRASIAVELLVHPSILLLDEPTSGLDPATAAEVLRVLRRLASKGTTVVLTTHSTADVHRCDRVVMLAKGGVQVFDGSPEEALTRFGVDRMDEVYEKLGSIEPVDASAFGAELSSRTAPSETAPRPSTADDLTNPPSMAGSLRQFVTLTRRSAELMTRNRLTGSILIGSPAMVITMMALLFRTDTFTAGSDPVGAIQMVYWIAFAGFFFGLTYGLLQIVTESTILKRERFWGLSTGAYVGSKVVILLPLLIGVDVALFTVLAQMDRLPELDPGTWTALGALFLLDALVGLALGLLASGLVGNSAQATLTLPMLCFPQVLFAGAMLPVEIMSGGGKVISSLTSNRWAFEAIGRVMDVDESFSAPGALGGWEPALSGSATGPVTVLVGMFLVFSLATVLTVASKTRT